MVILFMVRKRTMRRMVWLFSNGRNQVINSAEFGKIIKRMD